MNTLYEITFIVDENSTNEAVKSAVIATGANIVSETEVGVRRFIYPIAKKTSGKYFAIEFNADAEMLIKLEKQLKTDKGLIRYLIIKALRKPLVLKRENRDANGVEIVKTPEAEVVAEPVKAEEVVEKAAEPEEVTLEEVIENKPEELDQAEIKEEAKAEEEAETKQENKEEGIRNQEEKVVEKPKKQAPKKKPIKAEKISAEELDSKLAELVSED
jgi:small subunit ribosomal protein S6